jgi:hypothetical protein
MSDAVLVAIISAAPTILLLLVAIALLFVYRAEIRLALSSLVWRMKSGAHVKISSIELGPTYIDPQGGKPRDSKLLEVKKDKGNLRFHQRTEEYYRPNRGIFLVHRLYPSTDPKELYDIEIYLIPHKSNSLIPIQRVEYYFGKFWPNRIFVSTDRSTGFRVSTSAYGPFVCTAEVHFTDGDKVMLSRYIDFEMGTLRK